LGRVACNGAADDGERHLQERHGVSTSVVVLSLRPGTWLEECLASALDQADELILVDNGSPAEEASAIGRRLGAIVVRSPVNLGFAAGVNLGLRRAKGDLVGLLNDDAIAGAGWLTAAAQVLQDPAVAAVTPKVLLHGTYGEVCLDDEPWFAPGDARPLGRQLRSATVAGTEVLEGLVGPGVHQVERGTMDGSPLTWRWTSGHEPVYVPLGKDPHTDHVRLNGDRVPIRRLCHVVNHAGSYLRTDGYAAEYGLETPDDGQFDQATERFGFSGTAPVFRAETFRHLGGLVPEFFAYNEDTDWCFRARLAGLRIAYDPRPTVWHRLSMTSGGPSQRLVRLLAQRNRLLCLVRNAPLEVARSLVWQAVLEGPNEGVRKATLLRLPWALGSRARLRRRWVTTPRAVWDRWAGSDTTWEVRGALDAG
jgi:GT2 family glycosyltransferase